MQLSVPELRENVQQDQVKQTHVSVLAKTCRAIAIGELLLLTGPFPLVDSRFNGKHAGLILTVFAAEKNLPNRKRLEKKPSKRIKRCRLLSDPAY